MKKMVIVLTVALASGTTVAFQGSQLIQKETTHNNRFLDAAHIPSDEYTTSQHDIDEYDQNVCDDVQPPKVSTAKALLTEMLGFVLVRYITMSEYLRIYCKDLKDILNRWFSVVVKS